jgi:dTDP-4-amino-4,6-dideoxygalactose transaminase
LDKDNNRRKEIAQYFIKNIKNKDIVLPKIKDWNTHVFHIFPILVKGRDNFQEYLTKNGIQTLIHYPIPPHKQQCYKSWYNLSFPITEQIHKEELSLPISPVMKEEEVNQIINIINSYTQD